MDLDTINTDGMEQNFQNQPNYIDQGMSQTHKKNFSLIPRNSFENMSSDLRILSRSYQSEIDFGSEDRGIKEIQDLIPNPESITSQDQSTNDVSRSLWRDQRNHRNKGIMDNRSHNAPRKNLFPEVEQDCQNLTPNSRSMTQ